ncbi:MAG TPA: sugar ABC transporter ATP-binding protein [Pseudonocardiaceae bacterium]|jgi:L-arabinose transport system ATP-binding protein|nr:sugar ABC transporter ATP-binding protein [Pseudonocardiaceae bacterium]
MTNSPVDNGAEPARLRITGVSKSFAGVHALRDVSLLARGGEVLALMGENGAGKSTLLKVLSGAHRPDSGTLAVDGDPVEFHSPRDAQRLGVRVIYQEPEIIPHITVAENIYVGSLPRHGRVFDRKALHRRVRADLDRYGFAEALDPTLLGSQLSPAQRQLVEILRALVTDVRVIAFDEPTSSLSDAEVDNLFLLIGRLRAEGIAVIYVSHRMKEIFQVADRVTVLRDGAVVGTRDTADTDQAALVRMMVGRDLSDMFVRDGRGSGSAGPVMLEVTGLTNDDVTDISLSVRSGEVLGLSGLVGAGRSELAHAIMGSTTVRSGRISVGGRPVRIRSPRDAIRAGIGFAPEERKAQALLLHRSVRDNISLAVLDRLTVGRFVRRGEERRIADRFVRQLNVRTQSIEALVSTLSGGNQQKVVLARWLARKPRVLILDEPTRGVDVGAKAEIYSVINALAADGVAVIVISSELPEILGLADRVLVMAGGRITGELSHDEATEERVLALAMAEDLTNNGVTQ